MNEDHYTAKDLNHPIKLPTRSKGLMIYDIDPPLTQLATSASNIVARALSNTSIKWDRVISAPELASVQTAAAIALVTTGTQGFESVRIICPMAYRIGANHLQPRQIRRRVTKRKWSTPQISIECLWR
ncbi:unnamed protein product [Cylicostephanus goldi]|uniref:Uncharacterized protein n=1 Tax=Cylicostephanus goldi TaxID=71465 RepID=A0A3P6S659_CYLGO|nr:unnamed protein product [Cylicostephanus goldi]